MKIAFTAKGVNKHSAIDPRFGRTEYFLILDQSTGKFSSVDNRSVEQLAHGAGPKTAQKIIEAGVDVIITGNGPGNNAARALRTAGMKIFSGAGGMTVEEAYKAYQSSQLTELKNLGG